MYSTGDNLFTMHIAQLQFIDFTAGILPTA